MTSTTQTRPKEIFKFETPEGHALCRNILSKRLPFGPHDYQLDGISAVLDGVDLLAISATGSGKSAYIYMTLHVILGILEDPGLCPTVQFPNDPAILVICPTTALEEDQSKEEEESGSHDLRFLGGREGVAHGASVKEGLKGKAGTVWPVK